MTIYSLDVYSFSYLEPVCCSMSSYNCCIQISQEAGQVVWCSHLFQNFPQFVVIHTVKGFGIVNKSEIDVFLELSCFFDDITDVGNLNSGSFAFSKTSLNIWKFMVHVLLKPGLENFEHYFDSMWDLGLEWKLSFSSPIATAEFARFAGILSAALSQRHLLECEIAQLEFHHLR